MSHARHGISQHLMCESFERVHKHLRSLGYTDQEATRGAITLTLALSGEYTREQAFEAGRSIAPATQCTTTGVTPAESTETDLTQLT